ncbi:MAG: type II secretion system protein [Opitutaceae bacterium]|jgi:prepilin-type processing-associated H-X9-DG protein
MRLFFHHNAVRRFAAFTLVELLAVIAMIGVLAGILIPVVTSIRQGAGDVQAANNIRQLAVAEMAYASEHHGQLTPIWNYAGDLPQRTWMIRLVPYIYPDVTSSSQLSTLRRSSDTAFDMPEADRGTATAPLLSVAMNWSIATQFGPALYPIHSMPKPSSIIMLGEIVERNSDTMIPHDIGSGVGAPGTPGFRRSGTKAMMAFCDGHVAALTVAELTYNNKTQSTNPWRWW